uniref:Uncharacterized protein LOC102806747 n=1 Tax=Saccoglossus kowalevskii TaxID=10224 RepID=A0ABM0M9X5_SACKO|nr:PREDICTED: uncharacterized protein LOC102806747 [Saccoglossus kowalevskii]
MGMDFQNMQEIQGAEVHELENPTFFDFEEMTSPGGASAVLQEQEEQARTQMASIANRPIQNPKNNIVSVKVTNDLRADFNKHGARPRMANSAEQPSIVTDGRRMKMTSSKNNLGNFENKEVGFEEEDNLKKELFVSLNNESVMYQNPSYDTVDGAQSAQPMNALQTEQKNNQGNETNKKKTSVKELAMKFQSPGVRSSQQEFKNNPVYESDDEAQDDVHD